MSDDPTEARGLQQYDIERESAASRDMLKERIPDRLNTIKLAVVKMDQSWFYEPWRIALTVDLGNAIGHNCAQLLETMETDRLPAAAWIARNLLELLVWVKYCGVSSENAWRFHEDALRDVKGLMDAHAKTCNARGIVNEMSATGAERLRQTASEKLGVEEIDAKYLAVVEASRATGVDFRDSFAPLHKWLSKLAHPTAGLVHGITHHAEACRQLRAVCTTQGVSFAAQATIAIEAQLGLPSPP